MSATTTSRRNRGTATATPAAAPPAPAKHSLTEYMQLHCKEVELEVGWFTTSKKAETDKSAEMLDVVDASSKGVSVSKRMYTSKHPAVKAVNAARTRVNSYFDSMTIPVSAIVPADTVDPLAYMTKQPSTRLILVEDLDEFLTRVEQLTEELMVAARAMDAALPEIQEMDRQLLGRLYNPDNYEVKPSAQIRVRGPYIKEVGFRADFSDIAPKACARAMAQVQAQLDNTVKLAAMDFRQSLVDVAEQIAGQLAVRTRLMPRTSHPRYAELFEAEVICVARNSDDVTVPPGHVQIQVRKKKARGSGKSEALWLDPMTDAEYESLQPRATDEKRKIYDTSLENLREKLQAFHRIGSMIDDPDNSLRKQIDTLTDMLCSRNGRAISSEDLLREVRNSSHLRETLYKGLQSAVVQIREGSTLVAPSPVRSRRIGRLPTIDSDE